MACAGIVGPRTSGVNCGARAQTAHAPAHTPFPVRGTLGGWVDVWDEPIGHAALRAAGEASERRFGQAVATIAPR